MSTTKSGSTYTFMMEHGTDGGWAAVCPDLPGLILTSDTREALFNDAELIIADYLSAMADQGFPTPKPGEHVRTIAISA